MIVLDSLTSFAGNLVLAGSLHAISHPPPKDSARAETTLFLPWCWSIFPLSSSS
jgi:hypothetical protein